MNILKVGKEFEKFARGESIEVLELGSAVYAFGSELACLRLANVYKGSGDKAKAAYSENRGSWFFRLEM